MKRKNASCRGIYLIAIFILFVSFSLPAQPIPGRQLNSEIAFISQFIPGDENWDDRFHRPDILGRVDAVAVAPNGDVYLGGIFNLAGVANNIVRWDGLTWSALGSGIEDVDFPGSGQWVRAIAIDNDGNVYVGGRFAIAGGIETHNIAKWDGDKWTALGTGTDSDVVTISIGKHGEVYAGGYFRTAGGDSTGGLSVWDGSNWSSLSEELFGGIHAIKIGNNDELFVGGSFLISQDTLFVRAFAKLEDGQWSGFDIISGEIWTLALDGEDIYVGGNDISTSTLTNRDFLRWDGSKWIAIGSFAGGPGTSVFSITQVNDGIFVAGVFNDVDGLIVRSIAKWDGNTWLPLNSELLIGVGGTVWSMAVSAAGLIVGGEYWRTEKLRNIATWSGARWSAMDERPRFDLSDGIGSIASSEENIYVSGSFERAGDSVVNHVAKWDGVSWSPLGDGLRGTSSAIVVNNKIVYATESFEDSLGDRVCSVKEWNGDTWNSVGNTFDNWISVIAVTGNGEVYAGGRFFYAGETLVNHIAKWDGENWVQLQNGIDSDVRVICLDENDNLYAGGTFEQAGNVSASKIAQWDGSNWTSLAEGISSSSVNRAVVSSLAVSENGAVYVGGRFDKAGSLSVRNIAGWNGSVWDSLGSGLDGMVFAIAVTGEEIYAAGTFRKAGAVSANNIAKWDGEQWTNLGSGITDGQVTALAATGNLIHVGGVFRVAGGNPSHNFAIWSRNVTSVKSHRNLPEDFVLQQNYPNPFNPETTILYSIPKSQFVSLKVYDLLGREVRILVAEHQVAGTYRVNLNVSGLASGVYFYSIKAGRFSESKKMLIIK